MPSVFPPGARLGLHYRVARVVAHGPIAALYEAHAIDGGDLVAFKWLHAQSAAVSQLADRAREAQRVIDESLVRVRDVVREDDSLFVVSSWERGEPYSHLLAQHLMPLEQRLGVLAATLRTLAVAHRAGVAHCGVHPDNLFLSSRSGVAIKLLDLALNQTCGAALCGRAQQVALGHHVFMAPEQLAPDYAPNVRTDVFAAAVLLYQGLSGRLPFTAPDVDALRAMHHHEPPRVDMLRSDVPRSLALLLASCLARLPTQRPSNLEELAGELARFANEVVPGPPEVHVPGPLPMSATQSQARGELVLTPRDTLEPESESVSQPISFHGEHRLPRRRWDLAVIGAFAAGALLFALIALLGTAPRVPRSARRPPPLPPVVGQVQTSEATSAPPDAARPAQPTKAKRVHRHRSKKREPERLPPGSPLSRDDF